ncbi:Heat shock 70 kDa protein 12B [Trichoderma ghanense]|uniref:Heat shock 70 kDa protein 12B n=1 Tax=Trichoderma ghanense TaxID=65468 RepID=A0ABY2HCQ5_9HYPO
MLTIREKTKLIVGIDYGTTYSGLSFAYSNATDFKDIFPWTKYPGSSSHGAEHCVKAPTQVAFADENPELEENAWGYQVEAGMRTCAWTKLLLDKSSLASAHDDPDLYLSQGMDILHLPKGRSAKDVATEYLRGMKRMFDTAVKEHLGAQNIDHLPIDFWLTVPASWSEKAKMLTKSAATDAGFATRPIDRIMLISEPEAAAQLALKSSLHRLEDFVKPNTGVMICDCGGGTVDITTYEVEETQPTLKLREIAIGIAGKCGGTFVDRNLYRLLAQRFGDAFTSLEAEQIGPGSAFMDQFELKKKDFSMKTPSKRAHRLVLHMPQLQVTTTTAKYYEKRSSSVLLTQEDYKMLFDPVIDMIIGLVQDQVKQIKAKNECPIEAIVLVGGFGSSPYLKERLTEWSEIRGIKLTTPITGAWSAVVCGAVLRGLEGDIVRQKKSRRHYGHSLSRPLIDQNTEINSEFEMGCVGRLPACGVHTLYSCNLDDAPGTIENERTFRIFSTTQLPNTHINRTIHVTNRRHQSGIEEVGKVTYTLLGVDRASLPQVTKGHITFFKIPLTLNIRLGDEAGHLVFRILYQGQEVGKAAISITDD